MHFMVSFSSTECLQDIRLGWVRRSLLHAVLAFFSFSVVFFAPRCSLLTCTLVCEDPVLLGRGKQILLGGMTRSTLHLKASEKFVFFSIWRLSPNFLPTGFVMPLGLAGLLLM